MTKHAYSYNIHNINLTTGDSIRVTGNIVVYSVFYTIAGAFLSYVLYYLFDEFNEKWESKGLPYQLFDVSAEVSIIGVVAFWLVYFINVSAPIIPVKRGLEDFVDSYTAGLFFMFAIFIFLGDLTKKLTYIFDTFVGSHFDRVFPAEGSMLDGTLRYSNRQKAGK
jgi:SNF family Na+-dependent transporter